MSDKENDKAAGLDAPQAPTSVVSKLNRVKAIAIRSANETEGRAVRWCESLDSGAEYILQSVLRIKTGNRLNSTRNRGKMSVMQLFDELTECADRMEQNDSELHDAAEEVKSLVEQARKMIFDGLPSSE